MPQLEDAVRAAYRSRFLDALDSGRAKPLLIPYSTLGAFIVPTLWLTIPHASRPWLYQTRWAVMAFVILFDVHIMRVCSSTNFACSYAAGLMASWGIIMSMNLLVWKRPQFEAARVIRVAKLGTKSSNNGEPCETKSNGHGQSGENALRNRKSAPSTSSQLQDLNSTKAASDDEYEYRWQTFPEDAPFLERLGWATDLSCSFRGAGWNYSISSIPRPPIPATIHPNSKVDVTLIPHQTPSGYAHPLTETNLLLSRATHILLAYITLDVVSIQMMKDPFFIFGPDNTYELPLYLQHVSPLFLLLIRECMSLIGIWAAITAIFSLNDIVQYYLLKTFFPSRAALWHYASTFGGVTEILDRGLAGWWGAWWHQTFRLEFLGPSVFLLKKEYVKRGSQAADAFGLFISFFQSGLMHTAGSITAVPPTKPWRAMLFFLLQGLGIALQQRLVLVLRKHFGDVPRVARRAGNLGFCLLWLSLTAPLFVNDMASTGLWLLEPVPISPMRYMGFGNPGDHWWRWDREHLPKLYPVKHWWEVGIAL
ncbi:hypothetical protein QQS21_009460 [Conoideocrella luteorostrata]|uniref:Wax synthase domain-containing protein n=1 Tax=Conoideocrella luteorostrata TaxID=1105319 RepID=A0AAJ0FQE0_9HYPO|nr:hypothetical protein QQS21_009460 [Conoideocrella luteorostrata]